MKVFSDTLSLLIQCVMVFVSVKVKFIVVIIIIDFFRNSSFFGELINSIHNLYRDIYWGEGVCSLVLMT